MKKRGIHYIFGMIAAALLIYGTICGYHKKNLHFTSKEYTISDDVKFQYVQIASGLDKKVRDEVNRTLYVSATEWLTDKCTWAMDCKWDIVFQSDKFITVCYYSSMRNEQISEQIRVYNTVDISNGRRIYLDDLIENKNQFVEMVHSAFPEVKTEQLERFYDGASLSEDEYFGKLEKFDPLARQFPVSYVLSKPDFYLTEGGVGIKYSGYTSDDILIIDGEVSGNSRIG